MDLVGYGSSDDEAGDDRLGTARPRNNAEVKIEPCRHIRKSDEVRDGRLPALNGHAEVGQPTSQNVPQSIPQISRRDDESMDEPIIGPVMGPSMAQAGSSTPASEASSRPQSPYLTTRSRIRDLTLPPLPNSDLPSPSTTTSTGASTDAKFARFLELKKQGVHFNEKLANSSALRNPSLLPKLIAFAGLAEEDQYASALSKDIWDPHAFPAWAHKEGLAKRQQELSEKQALERANVPRESVDFVQATTSGNSTDGDAPVLMHVSVRGSGKSATERVMAGLDQGKTGSPSLSGDDSRSRNRTMDVRSRR